MAIRLSRRQEEVLSKLLDLYHEGRKPIHYTTLAKHIGASPVSAYEMLRLLEAHGMVEAEFQRPEAASGPGRPMVTFRPTRAAMQRLRELAGREIAGQQEWEQVKARILRQIQAHQDEDLERRLDELLEHVAEHNVSLPGLAGITTAIWLSVNALDAHGEAADVRNALWDPDVSVVASLSALIGLGFSLAISKRLYYRLGSLLLSRAGQIVSEVSALNPEKLNGLADLLRDVSGL